MSGRRLELRPETDLGSIELMIDDAGTYGIRLAGSHGSDGGEIVLRADRVRQSPPAKWNEFDGLQRIDGKSIFQRTKEYTFVQALFRHHLKVRGIDPADFYDPSVSRRKKHQGLKEYFGMQKRAYREFNAFYKKLLDDVADPDYLRIARRFGFTYRGSIYRACCRSQRFAQLAETFPLLMAILFSEEMHSSGCDVDTARTSFPERVLRAREMVLNGDKLRSISDFLEVPYSLRRLRPGAVPARCNFDFLTRVSDKVISSTMPETTPKMRKWVRALEMLDADIDFLPDAAIAWFARNSNDAGRTLADVQRTMQDLRDYARHTLVSSNAYDGGRRFHPSMSMETVRRESASWHRWTHERAVSAHSDETETSDFPEPWIAGVDFGDDQIVPLTTQQMLNEEGARMRHCVSTYGSRVRRGMSYIYGFRRAGVPIATIELNSDRHGLVSLGQVQGEENRRPSQDVVRQVKAWLESAGPSGVWVPRPSTRLQSHGDDEIPF